MTILKAFKIALVILFHWSYKTTCLHWSPEQSFHCSIGKLNGISKMGNLRDPYNDILNPPHGYEISTELVAVNTEYNQIHKNVDDYPIFNIQCAVPPASCYTDKTNYFYRSIDGSCNNIENPEFGMKFSRYTRLMQPSYGDGISSPTLSITGEPLPSPRLLSLVMYGEHTVSDQHRSMAGMQWGQLVGHDISRLSTAGAPDDCCESMDDKRCFPIELQPFGPIYSGTRKTCLHFARSISDEDAACPRNGLPYVEKISVVTGYLDLSSIYGSSVEQSVRTREFVGGLLRITSLNKQLLLPISPTESGDCGKGLPCFFMPDMRNQIIPTLTVLHTILVREHNRIARALSNMNPHLDDEKLFQEARKINIAQYQKITYYDWLPLIIGPTYAYTHGLIYHGTPYSYVRDYNSLVNAAPYAEFSSAALRYLHNQIPGWFSLLGPNQNETLPLRDYVGQLDSVNIVTDQFDSIARGLVMQLQKQTDDNIDKEIKHYFERKPFEEFGSDLKAFDIQRGRDFGVPSYNDLREFCGLPRANDWSGFLHDISSEKIDLMQQLYKSPNDVDLSVGGSFEMHAPESVLGPTFQCIIGRQFLKSRIGDRFFFERENTDSGFTAEQLAEIRKSSLSLLICNNVDSVESITYNAFLIASTGNVLTSCDSIPQVNLEKWRHSL